ALVQGLTSTSRISSVTPLLRGCRRASKLSERSTPRLSCSRSWITSPQESCEKLAASIATRRQVMKTYRAHYNARLKKFETYKIDVGATSRRYRKDVWCPSSITGREGDHFDSPGGSPIQRPLPRQKMFFAHIFVAVVVTCREFFQPQSQTGTWATAK